MLYDVILIGGGVVGCATARELARYSLSVALLEKTEDICNGQSKANTAIVHRVADRRVRQQPRGHDIRCAENCGKITDNDISVHKNPPDRKSVV